MQDVRVAFFDSKPYDIKSFDSVKPKGFVFKYYREHLIEDTVGLAEGHNVVCVFVNDQLTASVIEKLLTCGVELIALRCSGYNNVDLKEAYGRIHTLRVPAYSPHAVAEHAVALMLTLNRKTHKAYNRIRDNNFNINGLLGFDLYGRTAGIIGTGRIGKALISILQGFGMKILAFDSYPDETFARERSFEYVELPRLYRDSDIISLHCPLTPESYHLVNDESLALMKREVMIINTSRGQLIDTQALIRALKAERIGYAGLDVYEEESDYFFEDLSGSNIADDVLARLMTFNNVLITSHQAFFTQEALLNIARTTIDNISAYFAGQPLVNEICYQCGEEKTAASRPLEAAGDRATESAQARATDQAARSRTEGAQARAKTCTKDRTGQCF